MRNVKAVAEILGKGVRRGMLSPGTVDIAWAFEYAASAVSRVAEWVPEAAGTAPELDRLLRPGEKGVDRLTRAAAEDFRRGAELARLFSREVELAAARALEAFERGNDRPTPGRARRTA
jgi:hypothetical protein